MSVLSVLLACKGEPHARPLVTAQPDVVCAPWLEAMSPDGAGRVAVAAGAEVRVVATADCRCLFILEGHAAAVTAVAFSPHAAHTLVTAGEDRTFKVWDLEAGTLVYQSSILCAASLTAVSIDPEYPRAAIGAADGVVRFFDLATSACACVQTINLGVKLRGALAAAAAAAAVDEGGGGQETPKPKP